MSIPPDLSADKRPRARYRARHCAELLGTGPSIAELAPALSLLGEKLARVLPAALARVTGGEPPLVRVGLPVETGFEAMAESADTLASHAQMVMGVKNLPLLATFAAAPVLRLVDRAFGGRGVVPDPLPDAFSLCAELLIVRLEEALALALSAALGEAHPVRPLRRDTSLRQLAPFADDEALLQLSVEIAEPGAESWPLTLAFPQATLSAALVVPRRRAVAARAHRPGPNEAPFADLPLQLTATLVDMDIAFSRLASLKAGDVLPVSVARAVPVKVGGQTVATGTVGDMEDRVAVQITQSF